MVRTFVSVAAALAGIVALGACSAKVDTPAADVSVSTQPAGEPVAPPEFIQVARTSRPVVVTDDRRGYWMFQGNNLVYVPEGDGTRLTGTYTVRDDLYCVNYVGQTDRCYRVYRTEPNTYALWTTDNQRYAVVTLR